MDAIKRSMSEMNERFVTRMNEFQNSLQNSTLASNPTPNIANIAAEFTAFRSFVLTALEELQLQVQVLSRKYDDLEMRSRRRILLVHGIPESKTEKITSLITQTLGNHFKIPELTEGEFNRCHRLGKIRTDGKPRAVLIKFSDISLRNKLWSSKSTLKNTGITLSEFLTKERHEVFIAARHRFGISKCWTQNGQVVVMGPDGTRNHIHSINDINSLASSATSISVTTAPITSHGSGSTTETGITLRPRKAKK